MKKKQRRNYKEVEFEVTTVKRFMLERGGVGLSIGEQVDSLVAEGATKILIDLEPEDD